MLTYPFHQRAAFTVLDLLGKPCIHEFGPGVGEHKILDLGFGGVEAVNREVLRYFAPVPHVVEVQAVGIFRTFPSEAAHFYYHSGFVLVSLKWRG